MADDTSTTDTPDQDGAATATDQDDTSTAATADPLGDAGKRAIAEERRKAKEAVARAKAAEAELAKVRQADMSEAEKMAAEAEQRGRQAAMSEMGQRLVRAEFRAVAAGRVANLDALLDDLNLAKFVDEDGEPDTKAIAKAVERYAPPADDSRAPGPRPDLSQGGTRNQTALNSDELTNALKAAVGAA